MQQDEAAVKRSAGGDQPRAGGSRARRVGARGGASRIDAAGGVVEAAAEPRGAAGHRRGDRSRPRRRGAGRDREGGARLRAGAARGREGRPEQDEDAVRLRADHGAVCRRHHAPLRRHRRDDSGRHLVAEPGDAGRAAVAEQPAAADHSGARVRRLAHSSRARRSTSRCRRSAGPSRARSRGSPTSSTPTRGRWRPRWTCRTRSSSWCPGCTPTRRSRPTRRAACWWRRFRRSIASSDKTTRAGGRTGDGSRARATSRSAWRPPDRVEVRRGLREDDLVVVGSRAQLKPGTLVTPKIMEPAAAEGAR